MDVAAWLQGLGLECYVPAFRDNDVDAEVLPELTADDLGGENGVMPPRSHGSWHTGHGTRVMAHGSWHTGDGSAPSASRSMMPRALARG